jgi:ankyrin repeat protein
MRILRLKTIALFLMTFQLYSCDTNIQRQAYAPGFDFALFKNTPIQDLSNAVEAEDTARISSLILKDSADVNFQEPKFGNTLLSLSLINNKDLSIKKLLKLGANPNIRSPKDNSSPFLLSCEFIREIRNPDSILLLLIRAGADVNAQQETDQENGGSKVAVRTTALQYLCENGLIKSGKAFIWCRRQA